MDIYKAGLYSYDYAIYTALKQLAKVGGYNNITFNIPEGVFGTKTEISTITQLFMNMVTLIVQQKRVCVTR